MNISLRNTFISEIEAGRKTGNQSSVTNAGLRLACLSGAIEVEKYLLSSMGIGSQTEQRSDSIVIAVKTHQSFSSIMSALKGAFSVKAAMNAEGHQALQVFTKLSRNA